MSNHKVIFVCDSNPQIELEAVNDSEGLISLILNDTSSSQIDNICFRLDKSTSIKLVKVLRTEIAKINSYEKLSKEREVNNG
jgi:hypothetical protein